MTTDALITDTTLSLAAFIAITQDSVDVLGVILTIVLLVVRILIAMREWKRGSHREHTRKED